MKPLLINTSPEQSCDFGYKLFEGPGFVLPFHMHDRYEITLIDEGSGLRLIGDNISNYSAGDLVLVGPMLPHQWQSASSAQNTNHKARARAISIFFTKDYPSKDFWQCTIANELKAVLELTHRGVELNGKLKAVTLKKIRQLTQLNSCRNLIILLDILQNISGSNEYKILASEGYEPPKKINTGRIGIITNFIFDNLEKKLSMEMLGNYINLHPGSVSREFKKATGYSVADYITKVRIGKATRLLSETDKQITDICYECGFYNMSNFNRLFMKNVKSTPSAFRKHRVQYV